MTSHLEVLRTAPVFGALRARALRLLLVSSNTVARYDGEHFFEEGNRGDAMYVLMMGSASVYRSLQADDKLIFP